YDTARRLTREGATTIPSSVYGGSSETDAVRSISRSYDTLGRPTTITSAANADGSGTVQNEVKYTHGTHGRRIKGDAARFP
ncbi:MAG: hypothetical protein IT425_10620, partial [Pirellulales bacterium]|nr:hypothetical protein [Pirellulales bacterium]